MSGQLQLVQQFRQLRALVIGDVMLDQYLEGSAHRLCSEGPVPIVKKSRERIFPGGAANAAANLQALGAQVDLLGFVGDDPAATRLRSALSELGIADRWLVEDRNCETHHKLRIQADGQYVVRFDEGDTDRPSPEARRRLLLHLERAARQADLIVISDYGYGVVGDAEVRAIRSIRREHPCPLVVDSKRLARFRRIGATIITPNQFEAQLLIAPNGSADGMISPDDAAQLGQQILEIIDAEAVAITLAGDGVMLTARDGSATHLPVNPVTCLSDVGAGDSFAAALGLALAAGADHRTAARIGVEAAALAVSKPGTATVQYQELLRRVSLKIFEPGDHDISRSAERLAGELEGARLAGKRIVFTNGIFDILHAGHVDFLRRAKALGDILVVGINSDRSAHLLTNVRPPINDEMDRLSLVSALGSVDHALLFDEEEPSKIIRLLRPAIHVKGGDYQDHDLPETSAVLDVGGRVEILPLAGSLDSSPVIDRIIAMNAVAGGDGS